MKLCVVVIIIAQDYMLTSGVTVGENDMWPLIKKYINCFDDAYLIDDAIIELGIDTEYHRAEF